jgi:hypothetical protein
MSIELALYSALLGDIKARIRQAQTRAMLSANAELVYLYWDIGQMIDKRQRQEGGVRVSFLDWRKICETSCLR